jgi:predicted metalloprotease
MTSLLQKINDLDLRIDNISTSGGGGTTDTTALQAQVDTNTTDISTLQTDKMNTLIAGSNISITGNVISTTSNITLTDGYLYESAKVLVIYNSTNTFLGSSTPMYIPFDSTRVINTTFFERLGTTDVVVKVAGKYKFDVTLN